MEGAFKPIELQTWKRKEYFEFYSTFDQPFFGLDTEIECTNALAYCKNQQYIILYLLYVLCP